jgi:hypothetical protein
MAISDKKPKKKPAKKVAAKRPAHRPTTYTDAIADKICAAIASGQTVRQVVIDGITHDTWFGWLSKHEYFSQHYARARDTSADMFETEILQEAMAVSPETASASRVKIDALKWVAARRAPKRYGDRVAVDHGGSIGIEQLISGAGDDASE